MPICTAFAPFKSKLAKVVRMRVPISRTFRSYCGGSGDAASQAIGRRLMTKRLRQILQESQHADAMRGHQGDRGSIESTCFAVLALYQRSCQEQSPAVRALKNFQNKDGSWPAFPGDEPDGCWVTALAVIALLASGREVSSLSPAIHWLLGAQGREAKWFWRWRFQAADKSVRFDPAKYGWSWVPGTTSWVIPTAFSVIALRQARQLGINRTPIVTARIEQGVSMLLNRMCPGGGWNAGNGMAFGVQYSAYIDATAIALLALAGNETKPGVRDSLA